MTVGPPLGLNNQLKKKKDPDPEQIIPYPQHCKMLKLHRSESNCMLRLQTYHESYCDIRTLPIRYLKSPSFASRPLKNFPQLKPYVQYKITVKP
jgi:hypothetical protein